MVISKKEYGDKGGIYKMTCRPNGKAYIGQTKKFCRRFREHINDLKQNKHHNQDILNDYIKYGEDAFQFEILYEGSENLDELEKRFIEETRASGSCYNVFSGGLIDYVATKEFGEKVSLGNKGKKLSDEAKKNRSKATKKQWENDDYRNIMIESAKKQWLNQEYREKMTKIHTGWHENGHNKLTVEKVKEARERAKNGEKISALATEYGVAYPTMVSAINGTTWKNI